MKEAPDTSSVSFFFCHVSLYYNEDKWENALGNSKLYLLRKYCIGN